MTPAAASTTAASTPRREALSGEQGRLETPVSRFKSRQGVPAAAPSPRRVRKQSWTTKAKELPSSLILSIETHLASLTFDELGYPIGISLNAVHFLVRLPSLFKDTSRWVYDATGWRSADERLQALQEARTVGQSRWATWISLLLVLLSIGNAVYLATRKRSYHLILRPDPIASPNATTDELTFRHHTDSRTWQQRIKDRALDLVLRRKRDPPRKFPVTRLDVWTPEYVEWSLRAFALYSPPVAICYHLLTPSTLLAYLVVGLVVTAQTYMLVRMYGQLLLDRRAISSEVMHEYDARFVKPRLSVIKKDAAVMTSQAETIDRTDLFGDPTRDSASRSRKRSPMRHRI